MLSKEEYIDIIETLDFFYGDNLIPTAELRKEKSKELQEKDLENFKQKINCLKQLINEHFELVKENEDLKDKLVEIESSLSQVSTQENSNPPLKFEDLKGIYRII